MTLLETNAVSKSFRGVEAVDSVSIEIESGEIVGLIGPNGAGKTTFFNCLTGLIRPDGGEILFKGEDLVGKAPEEIANRGIGRTFQLPREFTGMTVAENLKVGVHNHPGERIWPALLQRPETLERETEVADKAQRMLQFLGIKEHAQNYASDLSGGQKKLLDIGRSLMGGPELVLMDEPLAGVNPSLENKIIDRIKSLNEEGITFLIIEHEIEHLVQIVDRLVVLHNGSLLASGAPNEVINDREVIDAYLGDTLK